MGKIKTIQSGGHEIAYEQTKGEGVGVLVALGHKTSMQESGTAGIVRDYCASNNIPLTMFDYAGYGASQGEPREWETDLWLENLIDIIDNVIDKPVVCVGGSMGGYLMLIAAHLRPEKVHGLVGVAPGFGSFYQKTKRTALCYKDHTVPINFSDNNHFLTEELHINAPVRLIHGLKDDKIPFTNSINIARLVTSDNVHIKLLKGAGHILKSEYETTPTLKAIEELRSL